MSLSEAKFKDSFYATVNHINREGEIQHGTCAIFGAMTTLSSCFPTLCAPSLPLSSACLQANKVFLSLPEAREAEDYTGAIVA